MEAVLLSTPLSYLKAKEDSGKSGAKLMLKYKNDINKPISAILSLNTVAHTVGAAGVGAQAVKLFGEVYFGLISAVLTFLILILTEIIPKTIGARYYKQLSSVSSRIIQVMIVATYPLVMLTSLISKLLSSRSSELTTSREEISALVHIGAVEGVFGDKENKIIQNLIKLKSIKVTEIMTPRVVVSIADEESSIIEFLKNKDLLKFSRIPVFSSIDNHISGYVFRQTALEYIAEDKFDSKLKDIKRSIAIVPDNSQLLEVWELLLEKKEHIALVVDEYGGMDGIVTMEDIIETLLGFEIIDEKDTITDMQLYARERWKMRQEKYRLIDKIEGTK